MPRHDLRPEHLVVGKETTVEEAGAMPQGRTQPSSMAMEGARSPLKCVTKQQR